MEQPHMDYRFPPLIESIALEVKAITNWDKEHEVILRAGINGEVVVDITGTPGKWYLSTIDENPRGFDSGVIYIDRGAEWACINFGDIMKNARENFAKFKGKNIREIIR
jgi:hypothetical protein